VTVEVLVPGTQTTVQDLPGRQGLWAVGVPPSGAWDDRSFTLANRAVGNPPGAAGLEAVLRGPVLRFTVPTTVCVTGAATSSTVDGTPLAPGVPRLIEPGQRLDVGPIKGPGLRAYVAVAGGIAVPPTLGSRSTFLLGGFGGFGGRPLRKGDVLPVGVPTGTPVDVSADLPDLAGDWTIRVIPGPHGAPDYLTDAGARALFETQWRLDHRSDRTGVRLVGPGPEFARGDGGDAGLHPSNIHDSAYPVGGIMVSGGTPVIVGPDGPSLGGFVVPAVVIRADRWKLAQCRPGDRIRLVPVTPEEADEANGTRPPTGTPRAARWARPDALLALPAEGERPALVARRAGDHHLLVEVGPAELDLAVRLQVHLLAQAVGTPDGVVESVEGVRSLLLAVDETRLPLPHLAKTVAQAWQGLPALSTVELPAREVALPIAFDDPAAHEAMTRYQNSVQRADVFDIVAAATYLVVGLGDVYLGAPVAVPLDPAHRLVTTKYDPPRTWTPANAVGIGGTYLCVYGMEGPGGYQLVGRTVPVWRLAADPPWLLRQFDLLRFHPVSPAELLDLRADLAAGRRDLATRPVTLTLADLLPPAGPDTARFLARRRAAFAEERERWALATGVPA